MAASDTNPNVLLCRVLLWATNCRYAEELTTLVADITSYLGSRGVRVYWEGDQARIDVSSIPWPTDEVDEIPY